MSLKAPYLLVCFDVDPANPAAPTIMQDVQQGFPLMDILPLGVANVFAVEVPESKLVAKFREVATYCRTTDAAHGNALRWVVQLCRANELSEG